MRVIAFEAREPIAPATLGDEEARYVARAAAKRAAEFAAGRACARAALAALGIERFVLRPGAGREPLWPRGISGSITHTAGFCGAAVARRTAVLSIGIDAERRVRVHRRLWRGIATSEELRWLESLPRRIASDMAALVFSAKEAFFKAQFPLTREWLAFSDVGVSVERASVSAERGLVRFAASRALALESEAPGPWTGRYAFEGALVATGIAFAPRTALPSNL